MHRKYKIIYAIFRPLVVLFLHIKFGYRYEKAKDLPETYIVLSNHTTDFDPLFVAAAFPRQMFFVASEHISRWKVAYKFLKSCFAPIIRVKGTTAASTVLEMMRKVRSGANVCMFAEGARSWDGVTAPILASTGKVVKSAKCALVTFRIEGGYFVSPNWSQGSGTRRGRVRGSVVNVYTKEQLASMTAQEINAAIAADIHEDAYERQLASPARYKGKNLAERLENMLFICPQCGQVDSMTSSGSQVNCKNCGLTVNYDEYGMLSGVPFKTVKELFAWQKGMVEQAAARRETYTAPFGSLVTVEDRQERAVDSGAVTLSEKELICGETVIPMKDISDMAMHGRHALVFSTRDAYYELVPKDSSCTLKFHMLYQVYKNGALTQYSGSIR